MVLVGTAVWARKSSVFSLPRKTGSDDDARTDSDRLFQTDAAAAGKAGSPMVDDMIWYDRGDGNADIMEREGFKRGNVLSRRDEPGDDNDQHQFVTRQLRGHVLL